MPYKTNSDLPEAVRGALPKDAQDIFRNTYNSVAEKGGSDADHMKQAWGAVENAGYRKGDDGRWMKKRGGGGPGPSDDKMEKLDVLGPKEYGLIKSDDSQRLVYVWASVVTKSGKAVMDRQGHILPPDVLQDALHEYVTSARLSKVMHAGRATGEIVEAMVFTEDLQKALGIDLGFEGALVVIKMHSEEAYQAAKSGDLPMASIAGAGVLVDAA